MILCADKPTVVGQFDNLNQTGVGILAHTLHAGLLKTGAVIVVKLEAVTVTLPDLRSAIGGCHSRAFAQHTVISPETHGAAHIVDALLLFHQVDDIVGGVGVHLGRVGFLEPEHIAGKLYHHALHAQADAEGGNVVSATPLESHKFALDAALAEAGCDNDAVKAL